MKRRGQPCEAQRESKVGRGNRKCKGPEVGTSMIVAGDIRWATVENGDNDAYPNGLLR